MNDFIKMQNNNNNKCLGEENERIQICNFTDYNNYIDIFIMDIGQQSF